MAAIVCTVPQVLGGRPISPDYKLPIPLRQYVEWLDVPAEQVRSMPRGPADRTQPPQHTTVIGERNDEDLQV